LALIFLVLIIFTVSSFTKSDCLDFITSSHSTNLTPLDYQVWGNAGVLSQATAEAKKEFLSFKMNFSWFGQLY